MLWPDVQLAYPPRDRNAELDYAYDFTNEFAANEPDDRILDVMITPEPADGSLTVSEARANGPHSVSFIIGGGQRDTIYQIHILARTAQGRVIAAMPTPIIRVR